jgi:phosphoribosylglycinamide formyltransferase-1
MLTPKKIAIFASGSGTNAENLAKYFEHRDDVTVACVLSNNKDAYVLERAHKLHIPTKVFTRDEFYATHQIVDLLKELSIDLIVLAGFLWLVPSQLVAAYPKRIVNIHPALLPKYGGKGMYGQRVHQSVVDHHETESGITIHYVNEHYDDGDIIYQARCTVLSSDTADDVAKKVHQLEYAHFPQVIDMVLKQI